MFSRQAEDEKVIIEISAREVSKFITLCQLLFDDEEANPFYKDEFEVYFDLFDAAFAETLMKQELQLHNKRFAKFIKKIGNEKKEVF